MMTAKKYLLIATLYTISAIVLVLGITFVIDPYAITGAPKFANFNQYKGDINDYTRLTKKYQPLSATYDTLVIGNSRAEMGIDPAHQCFIHAEMAVYNLAMPGAGVRKQVEYALNLIYQQPVERVYLSVDFIDFISDEPTRAQPMPLRELTTGELKYLPSGEKNSDYWRTYLLDYYRALFSLDALVSSAETVVWQSDTTTDRDTNGFNPARDFATLVRYEGARALYDQKMVSLEKRFSFDWYLRDANNQIHSSFDDLSEFLQIARARNIEVVLFTHPFHTTYWELLEGRGLMPLYQQWTVAIAELAAGQQPQEVELWDFSGDSPYIHEVFPAPGELSGPLQWFWEPAHYRKELGDLMVDAMLSDSCGTQIKFGRKGL